MLRLLFIPQLVGALLCGCGTDPAAPGDDMPADSTSSVEPRSYAMGWAPTPPRPERDLVIAVVDSLRPIAEVAILHQEPPWTKMLAGEPISALVEDPAGLADFLRIKGFDVVFMVDPLDGLNRHLEPPELVAANRSLKEPAIRALHEQWVRAVAERIRPEWIGLASEINSLREGGDQELYSILVDMVNTLAPQVRLLSPGTQVFVSFQADQANGRTPGGTTLDHLSLIDDFDIDALGLSSYPFFFFDRPADVPDDHFAVFDEATDLPLLFVEGGWGSASLPNKASSPQQQVEWFDRYETLLDGVSAELWVMLTFSDLDIPNLGLDPARAQMLSNFATMGILDTDLDRKPAYDAWARIFARPRTP